MFRVMNAAKSIRWLSIFTPIMIDQRAASSHCFRHFYNELVNNYYKMIIYRTLIIRF